MQQEAWFGEGVVLQAAAFRSGFHAVAEGGLGCLEAFITPEVRTGLTPNYQITPSFDVRVRCLLPQVLLLGCGAAIAWDEATVRECVVPAAQPPTYEVVRPAGNIHMRGASASEVASHNG
jgi:hypothetical protein